MFRQLISNEGLHVAEINKNIQKLKKEYNMSVAEAVKFVKKEFPQFSDICDSFGPHFEYAEAAFKQKNFQKTEPRLSHARLHKFLIFILTLFAIFWVRKTYNSLSSYNSSPPRHIVDELRTFSLELITQAGRDSVDKIEEIEKVIKGVEDWLGDKSREKELDKHIDDIFEEEEYLHSLTSILHPDTTKITKLYLDKRDTEDKLEQATQRLKNLKEQVEKLKKIKKSEKQAKADADSGNRESKEQQIQQATKQQGEKRNEIKEKQAIKKAKIRIGINTKVLTPNK
jgi:hypothetical protein